MRARWRRAPFWGAPTDRAALRRAQLHLDLDVLAVIDGDLPCLGPVALLLEPDHVVSGVDVHVGVGRPHDGLVDPNHRTQWDRSNGDHRRTRACAGRAEQYG